MPTDETTLTLALVLTAGGAVIASGLITGLVQLVKQLGSVINGKERIVAFTLSAVLVVIAYAAGVGEGSLTVNAASLFAAFMAFHGIARLSMANYADLSGEANGLRGAKV